VVLWVVLRTVSGGFVLDTIWNYNVLQFVLFCLCCCVQWVVGLCWTVFGIIIYCSLCCVCVVLCTRSVGFLLDHIWNYNVVQFLLCCVWCCVQWVVCFVLDCIWNYNVLQFVLCCLRFCVHWVVGLCWTVFGIIIYGSLCLLCCGAAYSECWVCVRLYL